MLWGAAFARCSFQFRFLSPFDLCLCLCRCVSAGFPVRQDCQFLFVLPKPAQAYSDFRVLCFLLDFAIKLLLFILGGSAASKMQERTMPPRRIGNSLDILFCTMKISRKATSRQSARSKSLISSVLWFGFLSWGWELSLLIPSFFGVR